jgi:hypothetical protein
VSEFGVWIALSFGRVDPRIVHERVPGCLELWATPVDEIGILNAVTIDERKP